jgi:hypothetical protein
MQSIGDGRTDKGKAVVSIVLVLMVLSLARMNPSVFAHLESPIDSGWASTPPHIDGNMTAGEWADATVRGFTLNMSGRYAPYSFDRTLEGRLYVENNWTYAFLAVQVFDDDYEANDAGSNFDGLFMLFDNNHTGSLVLGDNGEGMHAYNGSNFYSNNDIYYNGAGSWDYDTHAGRNNDGAMAWSHTNQTQGALGNWTFEMKIPLVGSDDYDFKITALPKTVGFKIWFQEPSKGLDGVYPDDPAIARSFSEVTNATTFGDLTFYPLYNLTMIATVGGTTSPTPGVHEYPYKTVVTATATADPWYAFDHWELDSVDVGTSNPYSVLMNQNHTLRAAFHPLYALTIVTTTGGTTTPVPGIHVYDNGTLVNVTATADLGYDFDHWELDSVDVGTSNPYSVLMNQNHTLNAAFVKQLAVTISPSDVTITLGNSVTFSSIVTGGTAPYSYQWYLGTSKVSSATSSSWMFTPTSVGIYYVYLNVTDLRGRIAVSDSSRVVVVSPSHAVGGYTVSLQKSTSTLPFVCYGAFLAAFGAAISMMRRRKH